MANYKYNAQNRTSATYLQFEDGETKILVISDWQFGRGPGGYLFKCFVSKINDEEADMVWTIWDYDSAQRLKKKLGTKANQDAEITVKMEKNEDDDNTFILV